jgi:hypothetical protein
VLPQRGTTAKLLERARGVRLRAAGAEGRNAGHPSTVTSAVVRVDRRGSSDVLVRLTGVDFPNHNGQLLDAKRVVVSDSTRNALRVIDTQDARPLQAIEVPGTWLRGLEPLDAQRLFAGTAPAAIVLIDLEAGAIVDRVQLSDDPHEAIHGLTIAAPIGERI